ncbi:MAG: uroporphyrinogen decarboxylase [Actinomycetota bacterium]
MPTPPARDVFLRACRGEAVEHIPVWFMRQAGRSLPEYRALREKHDILTMCRTPDLVAEVTMQPVRRLGVDAAILFSDIVVPLQAMGVALDIKPSFGPVIEHPIRSGEDVERLGSLDPEEDLSFVLDAIRMLVAELDVPLIGFAGAPFTLASYLVEGGPSKDHARTKTLMFGAPDVWNALMDKLTTAALGYLRAQVNAGASAVQLFDSWVGSLAPPDYERHVLPHVARIFAGLADLGVPRIHFGVVTGELLTSMSGAGADVVGIDWRVPLDRARRRVGDLVVQGNLDPTSLFAPWDVVKERVHDVLERGGGHKHVFNLGHGVLPSTDPDVLRKVVEVVHGWSR